MALNFGPPKSATGFTLTTTTSAPAAATAPQFNFAHAGGGGGDVGSTQPKPVSLFGAPTTTTAAAAAAPATGFSLGGISTAATSTPSFSFGTAATSAAPQFNLGTSLATSAPSTTSTGFGFGTTTPATATSTGVSAFSLGTFTSTAAPTFGGLGASATSTASTFSLGGLSVGTTAPISTNALTFAQLEETINKWTIDLEEQGKVFANQAKHLNAWDRLLMSNGEKILSVSNGIERIKQQQQQLDQELDFVLAQQKELEDCIVPLEKEYQDVAVSDVDRDHTYKLAENIDAQLKQMSEDLKEIIEHLNESNKSQEMSDPVAQIGKILNAHMNSLQWIDRNTTQISAHLDEIAKMHDLNRRNENIHGA